jgi:hypothetical protein
MVGRVPSDYVRHPIEAHLGLSRLDRSGEAKEVAHRGLVAAGAVGALAGQ